MIPKTIHYCWFGKNPKPALAKKCIKSWKKHCKGYQMIEWNEDNFDLSSAPLYVRQAYDCKKWAFVTDYVRLWAMYNYGGIYMDTDVEVVKPLDKYLEHQAFSGFEDAINIPTGIMACEKGFSLFGELLCEYDSIPFLKGDGSMDLTTNVERITKKCSEHGFIPNGEFQIVDGFALYPKDVFCPLDYTSGKMKKTANTVTIHWFNGSWLSEEQKKAHTNMKKKVAAAKRKKRKRTVKASVKKIIVRVLGEKGYKKLRGIKE